MSIRIVTDSTCDLPVELVRANNITVIPMYINVGAEAFRDGVDLSRQEFYALLPSLNTTPPPPHPARDCSVRFTSSWLPEGQPKSCLSTSRSSSAPWWIWPPREPKRPASSR